MSNQSMVLSGTVSTCRVNAQQPAMSGRFQQYEVEQGQGSSSQQYTRRIVVVDDEKLSRARVAQQNGYKLDDETRTLLALINMDLVDVISTSRINDFVLTDLVLTGHMSVEDALELKSIRDNVLQ